MKILIENEHVNQRLDHFLVDILKINRSQVTTLIKRGRVLVNNQTTKPGFKLSLNDQVEVAILEVEKVDPLAPKKLDLNIVYEDEHIMVINKPKGLIVHPSNTYHGTTLVSGLLHHTNKLSNINQDPFRPGIIHRIDKDTSGLLLIAKTNAAHSALAKDLKKHAVKREYIALVDGILEHQKGVIDAPIARHPKVRTKMAVVPNGKNAVTHFEVMKSYKQSSLLHCKLETGRTHQIRVHLAYIKHPVIGDPLYGSKNLVLEDGQLLHAFKLEFTHPDTKKVMMLEAPLPPEFEQYLNTLG